jgi:hypothetical protein
MGIGDRLRRVLLAALLLFAGIALTAATPAPHGGAAPAVSEQTIYRFYAQLTGCPDGSTHPDYLIEINAIAVTLESRA